MYWIGELDERITLRREEQVQDEYGTLTQTPEDYAIVWAHVRPRSGTEQMVSDSVEASAEYLVVLRYRRDIAMDDTIIWRDTPFNIRRINDRGPRSPYLEIIAERGVAL